MGRRNPRIGVAGLRRAGWYLHCQELAQHPDFELIAVADADEERRIEGEREYNCTSFSVLPKMLEKAELDTIVIAALSHLHKEMAQLALRMGYHVAQEKTMAPDLE